MRKLKVGDKVKVRSDLKMRSGYYMSDGTGSDAVVEEMMKFKGKTVTISRVDLKGYKIEEDKNLWNWVDDMFKLKFTMFNLEVGMIVETRNHDLGLVIDNKIVRQNGFHHLYEFNDNLIINTGFHDFDIIKVYKPKNMYKLEYLTDKNHLELIWERKEKPKYPFKVGDIITGTINNGYLWTTDEAIMKVIETNKFKMVVEILKYSNTDVVIGNTYIVKNSTEKFTLTELPEVKEMTVAEIVAELGYEVKVVK